MQTQQNLTENYKFPVELQKLYTHDMKESTRRAVVRLDTNEIIADVSNQYKLVSHDHIFERVTDYMATFGQFEATYHSEKKGAKFLATFQFKDIGKDVAINDNVGLKIVAANSYDGKSSINLQVMGLRLKCLNGMAIGEKWFAVNYRHSSTHVTDTGELKIFDLPKKEDIVAQFNKELERFKQLKAIEVFNPKVILDTSRFLVAGNVLPERYLENLPEIEEMNYWGLYNQATEYITHTDKSQLSTKVSKLTKLNEIFFNLPEVKRVIGAQEMSVTHGATSLAHGGGN